MTNDTKFRPVVGTEQQIVAAEKHPGWVYFASDTGKIFFDTDMDNRVSMGGSGVSLFYGTAKSVEKDVEGYYPIGFDEIDSEETPKENDLILNQNGAFFKIVKIESGKYICQMLAISGTGGGGQGTGSGPSGGSAITLDVKGISSYSNWIFGQSREVETVVTDDKDNTVAINYIVQNRSNIGISSTKNYGPFVVKPGTKHKFDLGKIMLEGLNSVTVVATGDNGGTAEKTYSSLSTVIMGLNKSDFTNLQVFRGDIPFTCIPVGAGISKTLKIYVDGVVKTELQKNNITTSGQAVGVTIPALPHGSHTIEAILWDENESVSSKLFYEIACAEEGYSDPIIWISEDTPTTIVNYTALTIPYMVYNPEDTQRQEVTFSVNETQMPNQTIAYSATGWAQWKVTNYQVGTNILQIGCGNATPKVINVKVEEDSTRDLGIVKTGLKYNFDADGRSNKENITSRQTWESNGSKVQFNNFNWYNNGWITEGDDTFLRISNGASIKIPVTGLFKEISLQNSSKSYTFDFAFRLRNVQTYSLLVDTEVTEGADDSANVKKSLTQAAKDGEGVVISYFGENCGFGLGTQEAFFTTRNTTISGRYKEGEVVHLSFVFEAPTINATNPLMYIYVNGINSGIASYNKNSDALSVGNLSEITINSDFCDIDLYKLRIYESNLKAVDIVHNIVADKRDVALYDVNMNIVKYDNNVPTIDYEKMLQYNLEHEETPLMPYLVIETPDGVLPYIKDEKGDGLDKGIGLSFTNTYLDYAWANGIIEGLFDPDSKYYDKTIASSWESAEEFYIHHAPSYICAPATTNGAAINVQGTSSQGYPRRNYKVKMKKPGKAGLWTYVGGPKDGKTLKKWYLDSNIGESTFCFKADYMESSRTHNTGLASYVDTLYSKHPLQDQGYSEEESSDYRTAIYGFPMMVFHKYNGEYEFIGLYNYNLDKSCKDSFGFTQEKASRISKTCKATTDVEMNPSKTYYFMNEDKTLLSWAEEFEDGVTYYEETTETGDHTFTLPIDLATAAECWQIEHNQGGKCSFKNADFSMVSTDPNHKGVLSAAAEDFEIRYHAEKDAIEYAIAGLDVFETQSLEVRNNFLRKKMSRLEKLVAWVASTDPDAATNEEFETPITLGGTVYTNDTAEYRLAKFGIEFEQHFDLEYSVIYFIVTELLLCYDSRGKNCMLATWGPKRAGGEDIWYPIFYDIDTQLGINNSGVPYWEYYEEATKNNTFSTSDSVLWNNLWKTKSQTIKDKYQELRTGKLTYEKLNGYYSFNSKVTESYAMKGERPMIAVDVDEYYKYIDCAIGKGYVDTSGEGGKHTSKFFYCAQGTRDLQRELFLRNRLNYLDSDWYAGTYSTTGQKQQIQFRFDANNYPKTSDKYLNHEPNAEEAAKGFVKAEFPAANGLDTEVTFKLTPYLKQYMHLAYDEIHLDKKYGRENQELLFKDAYVSEGQKDGILNTANYPQQLIYLGGAEYISSLGDLSKLYLDEVSIVNAKRLKNFIVGSDAEGYFNSQLNSQNFHLEAAAVIDGKVNENAKSLLEEVVLTNLINLDGEIDVSGSEKLKTLRALNTQVASVALADGTQIETLHLPKTITTLILREPVALTKILSNANSYIQQEIKYNPVDVTEETFSNDTYYVMNNGVPEVAEAFSTTRIFYKKTTEYVTKFPVGLYIEGLTDKTTFAPTDATKMDKIDIIGGNMRYGSYVIANSASKIKTLMQTNETLSSGYSKKLLLNLENINWSPYRKVEIGEVAVEGKTYHKRTEHCTFTTYTPGSNWDKDILNGYIYEFDPTVDTSVLKDMSFFDMVIEGFEHPDNYILSTDTDSSKGAKLPYISGIVYVDNKDGAQIKESDIKNKYINQYWPDLEIYVANVEESYVAKFITENNDVEVEIESQKFDKAEFTGFAPITTPKVPVRTHNDFVCWVDSKGKDVPFTKDENGNKIFDFSNYIFTNSNKEFIFTAKFELHKYEIKYVYDEVGTQHITYNERLHAPLPSEFVPYKDDSKLDYDKTYKFSYWSQTPDGPKVEIEDYLSIQDYTFYAHFDEISVYDNVLDDSILEPFGDATTYPTDSSSEIKPGDDPDFLTPETNGVYLQFKSGINLKGKITLPIAWNGKPVFGLHNSSVAPMTKVTHVFWEQETDDKPLKVYQIFNGNIFQGWSSLKYFEIPASLRVIGAGAFNSCPALEIPKLEDGHIIFIGQSAFNGSLAPTESGKTLVIPSFLLTSKTAIRGSAFSYTNPDKLKLQFGTQKNPIYAGFANLDNNSFTDVSDKYSNVTVYYDPENASSLSYIEDPAYIGEVARIFGTQGALRSAKYSISEYNKEA